MLFAGKYLMTPEITLFTDYNHNQTVGIGDDVVEWYAEDNFLIHFSSFKTAKECIEDHAG